MPRRRIPEREWKWDGHAGHLIVGDRCQFHLNTRIGNYRISTVGEYRPQSSGKLDGERLGGKEYAEFHSVGLNRLFETFVFECSGAGFGEVDSWMEIDSDVANDHDSATEAHMKMCDKYARIAARVQDD